MRTIVIKAPSGLGKTYALRKVFNTSYGYKRACKNPLSKNRWIYIPEMRNTRTEGVLESFDDIVANNNVVTSINSTAPFALKRINNPIVITLTATDEEIARNINSRPKSPNGKIPHCLLYTSPSPRDS